MSGFGVSDLNLSGLAEQVRLAGAEQRVKVPERASEAQLREAAQAFEQIMLGMMVEQMREAIPESGLLPELPGRDLYEQMLDQEYLRGAGSRGLSLGIADAMVRQFEHHAAPGADPAKSNQPSENLTKGGSAGF